nr:MAG TPA: hypothetical protein [Caudoviricetes sp.]
MFVLIIIHEVGVSQVLNEEFQSSSSSRHASTK